MPRQRLIVLLAVLGPWLVLFGSVLTGNRSFAFRDASHYYYPLFQWAQNEWGTGRVPLWNPQENCGVPVLAETAASVLYPPKVLLALPLGYAWRYNTYVALHVLLAAATAYLLARRLRASVLASGLCGLSYAFGGNVLFQYCNVVFLVGAAWLPLALATGVRLIQLRRWPWAVGLGSVLALMTLGGDPQAAYHGVLLLVLYASLRGRRSRRRLRSRRQSQRVTGHSAWRYSAWRCLGRVARDRRVLLGFAGIWGFALGAVQILPAAQWTRQSQRAAYDAPRNLYEAAATLGSAGISDRSEQAPSGAPSPALPAANSVSPSAAERTLRGLVGRLEPGAHHARVFDFSIGPWRWAEFVWPNFSGRLFPVHRRWLNVIPAEGRVWNPSLYIGLLPVVLALVTWSPWSRRESVRWLSWTVLLFGLGSLGWYGLGWLGREVYVSWWNGESDRFPVGSPVGGIYWLFTVLLPGYVYFRYPAKLMVVASLGLSLLAAIGWDRAVAGRYRGACRWLLGLAALSTLGGLMLLALRRVWAAWLEDVRPDRMFGPLDAEGAWSDLAGAFLQTLVLSLLLVCLLRRIGETTTKSRAGWLLVLTAIDLCLAHGWTVAVAPADVWRRPSWAAALVQSETGVQSETASSLPPNARQAPRASAEHPAPGLPEGTPAPRVFRASFSGWRPERWFRQRDPDRLRQIAAWERDTLFPKFQLLQDVSLTEAYGTIASADLRAYFRVARQLGWRRADGVEEPHPAALRWLNTEFLLLPAGATPPSPNAEGAVAIGSDRAAGQAMSGDRPAGLAVYRDRTRFPRAWIVYQAGQLPELKDPSPRAREARTHAVLFPGGHPRRLEREAIVETDLPLDLPDGDGTEPAATCRILSMQPQRVEIVAELERPGLLVLSDLYTADWRATISSAGQTPRSARVLRTNRIMRGVLLPAGRSRVVLSYWSHEFLAGALISGLAGIAAAAIGIRLGFQSGTRGPIASRRRLV